jgi:hypothetical protein
MQRGAGDEIDADQARRRIVEREAFDIEAGGRRGRGRRAAATSRASPRCSTISSGAVRRARTSVDQRAYRLSPTPAGRRLLAEFTQRAHTHERTLDRIIGAREQKCFVHILNGSSPSWDRVLAELTSRTNILVFVGEIIRDLTMPQLRYAKRALRSLLRHYGAGRR